MAHMNVFNSSAFSMVSLTAAFETMPYIPNLLGSLNIFESKGEYTRDISVEKRGNVLALITTSANGEPPRQKDANKRSLRNFKTSRLAEGFTMYAHEVSGIRAFGKESELEAVKTEYAARMRPVRDDMDLTHEYHRLGALQGKLLDADGTSIIYDYFDEFGIDEPSVIDFKLDVATTDIRKKCHDLIRSMARSSGGAFTPRTKVHALCGDEFYDSFVTHPKVERTYENWSAAQDLRKNLAFSSFEFGGVIWHNYRGTDDESTVAVPANEAKFFPVGARGVFRKAISSAEFGSFINTRGKDIYTLNVRDKDRDEWVKGEMYSYPLYMCLRPETLRKGIRE